MVAVKAIHNIIAKSAKSKTAVTMPETARKE
jgi:hypothetical protein